MEDKTTPPPFTAAPAPDSADKTPMYGSTASHPTDTPAAPAVDAGFLSHISRGFWE